MAIPRIPSSTIKRINTSKADFLRIDSEVGLTLSGIALGAIDKQKRKRTAGAARRAYDTIMRLRDSIELTDAESTKLDHNLLRLKLELQTLGETF